ncbi:phage tail protein [Pseudescherichia sp.]|uniref:phage tail tip fiber protein n=1 Tax=Pseudescherichia sp. TaxID=2055881 RepID=UPI00289D9E08|nr:phage tail protein [Pseudescherichia sp.]
MGKKIGGFVGALITAVVVAAAVYFTGGTALTALAWGGAAGAISLVATSMLGQIGVTGYGDVTDSLSRSTSPTTGLPVIYGGELPHKNGVSGGSFVLTGTICTWYNIPNSDSQYLFSEQAVCYTGVQNHIEQIYIDNEPVLAVPVTSDGIIPTANIAGKYQGLLQLEVTFGGDYKTTKTLAKQYAGPKWTNKFLGKGVCTVSAVIKKTQDSLEQNLLTNDQFTMQVELKGQEILSLVTGTKFATSNPPSIIYDYLTNTIYGMGIEPALINLDTFIETASYCHQLEYYANGAISYQSTYKENIESILQVFGGIMYVHAGQICMTTDRKTLSVASFDEHNMVGSVQITTSGGTDYFNTVDAKFVNPLSMYATDVLRIPSDITTDEAIKHDGQVITLSRDYSWCYDQDTLARMVNVDVLKAKYALRTISFTTSEGWDLKVWDAIDVKNDELAINGKFKVLSKDVATDQENVGYVTITAVEAPDQMYDGVDVGIWSPGGVINFPQLTVIPPTELNVSRMGNITSGSVVEMSWKGSTDPYLRGYYVYYRLSNASNWTYAGSISKYQTDYELFNLSDSDRYDFAVAAYSNIGLVSDKLTLLGLVPSYSFALPAVTGLHLVNNTVSQYETDSGDFNIAWNDQTNLKVNGRTFSEYFKQYEVRIYNGNTLAYTYNTQQPSFDFTFEKNAARIRKPTIGIIARGYTSGTYSEEVKITVENKQHKAPSGSYKIAPGYKSLFVDWDDTKLERDYVGTYISIQNTVNSTVTNMNTASPQFTSFTLSEGTYKVKLAHYDIFGIDNLNYTPESTITVSGDYHFSEQDVENINDILNLNTRLSDTLDDAIAAAYANTNTVVTLTKQEFDSKISASQTLLQTQITDNNSAMSQRIGIVESSVGDNNSKIVNLTQTVANNNSAQTQSISQLQSTFNYQIGSVNTQLSTKADAATVNSSYTMSVNANGVVAGFKLLASTGATNTSAMYFAADKFIISPTYGVTTNAVAPFAVYNGIAYLNNAIIADASIGTAKISDASITVSKIVDGHITNAKIQDGAITNAKIANTIQSNNYYPNYSGWQINKDGTFYINGNGGTGRLIINNNQILIYDNNSVLRVRMGLW